MNLVKIAVLSVVVALNTGCSVAQMKQQGMDSFYGAKNALNDPQEETVEVAVMNGDKKVGATGDVYVTVYEGSEYTLIRKSAIGSVECTVTNPEGEVKLLLKSSQGVVNKVTKQPYGLTDYTPHGNVNDTKCIAIL